MKINILKKSDVILFKDIKLGDTFHLKDSGPSDFYLKVTDVECDPRKERAVSLTTNRILTFRQDCECILYPLELRNVE